MLTWTIIPITWLIIPMLVIAGFLIYLSLTSGLRLLQLRRLIHSLPQAQRLEAADLDPFDLPLYCRLDGVLDADQLLTAPISGEDCLWYLVEVSERGLDGTGALVPVVSESSTSAIRLTDASGVILIDPEGLLLEAKHTYPGRQEPERTLAIPLTEERQLSYADWRLHHAWKHQTTANDAPVDPLDDPSVYITEWILPTNRSGIIYGQPTRKSSEITMNVPAGQRSFYLATTTEQIAVLAHDYRRLALGTASGVFAPILIFAVGWLAFLR